MNKLKPCPFCGGKDIQIVFQGLAVTKCGINNEYVARCGGCGAQTAIVLGEDKAITAWSRRYKDDVVE